jgi:hypothetical protein
MSDDYEVGYGKPPKSTQFKPGQSGNPKGRPKGTKNLVTDLNEELSEKIVVTEGGKPLTITKQRAMIKSIAVKAMSGDVRAATILMRLMLDSEQASTQADVAEELLGHDKAILDRFAKRLLAKASQSTEGDDDGSN